MDTYRITSKKELRRAFWQLCEECGRCGKINKSKFNLDRNMCFNEWIDGLQKDGVISVKLRMETSLY